MKLNNLSKFPMSKYETYLSCFGRKVLNVLLEQCQSEEFNNSSNKYDRNNHRNAYQRSDQHTSVSRICSNDANILINTSNNYIVNDCYSIIIDEEYSTNINTELIQKNTNSIPTSEELVKCNQDHTVFQETVENPTCNWKPADSTHSRSFDAKNYKDHLKKHPPTNSKMSDAMEEVAWEDMFDSLLLSNQDYNVNGLFNNKNNSKASEIEFTETILENGKTVVNKNNSRDGYKKEKNELNTEGMISKTQKIPKEIEKCKRNFRKQKYTKAVKNWLNDVKMSRARNEVEVQAQVDTTGNSDKTGAVHSKKHKIGKTFETASGEFKVKKTFQTKLSNQNGVMKFCKPDDVIKTDEDLNVMEINKDTKIKSKFIPPIKSQIPVKDLTYTILFVDDDLRIHLDEFRTAGEEIVMTLMYSDFCQLNVAYAQETVAPQGIMILVRDTFYCLTPAGTKHKDVILQLMGSSSVICYEGKNILIYLSERFGLMDSLADLKILDAKIGSSLLDPDNPPDNFSDLQKVVGFVPKFSVATECPRQKAAWYMCTLRDCWSNVQQALLAQGLWSIFIEIEMRVLPVVAAMEHRGICVDLDKLKSMEAVLLERMKSVELDCYKAAGKSFQINSTVQVRAILYDELELDSKCNVKIRETICKGAKSTSETMLRSLMNKHPLPKLILEYRHLHKAHATFLSGIAHCARDGVVRPVWEQSAASTGRIACSAPNIQAVPKTPFSLTLFPADSDGRAAGAVSLRSVYTARAQRLLLAADFRQAECRVLALAAADVLLLRALHSDDLFRVLAAEWMKKPEEDVTSEERERTKRVVYASMYGAGAGRLAEVLGRGYEHARTVAASFNSTFPSLKSFGRAVVSQCERDGKLRTPCGRVRHFKDIASAHYATKAQAERKAINFIIQGSAADLCKMAMVKTEERLRSSSPPVECRLLLQIHDELVWEVRDEHLHAAAVIIKSAMENCGYDCGLPTVLPVALSVGRNWGEMKEFTPKV